MGPPPPQPKIPEFGPGRPWDPYLRIGGIGGNRSPLSISKNVVIGPILSQKTVWPMYALVYPAQGLGHIGGIRSHLVSSKSVVVGPMFDPCVIGGKYLIFDSFGPFLASDGLGTRGKRFLGPVSPPVHLSGGRRTQIGPCLSHFWVLWARFAFDLFLRVGV